MSSGEDRQHAAPNRAEDRNLARDEIFQLLPSSWRADLDDAHCVRVSSGLSGAAVWRVRRNASPDLYLKWGTGSHAENIRQEIVRTAWLHSHGANVPPILRSTIQPQFAAVLLFALPGEPVEACNLTAEIVIEALGYGFRKLHSLPLQACPFDEGIPTRLKRAEEAIAEGQVDPAAFRSSNANLAPEGLFRRLIAGIPSAEDPVVVHGDATFTNILIDGLQQIGFVDCGHAGRADRYVDLALVASEIEERYGKDRVPAFWESYGLSTWDAQRAEFFLDLYEFF